MMYHHLNQLLLLHIIITITNVISANRSSSFCPETGASEGIIGRKHHNWWNRFQRLVLSLKLFRFPFVQAKHNITLVTSRKTKISVRYECWCFRSILDLSWGFFLSLTNMFLMSNHLEISLIYDISVYQYHAIEDLCGNRGETLKFFSRRLIFLLRNLLVVRITMVQRVNGNINSFILLALCDWLTFSLWSPVIFLGACFIVVLLHRLSILLIVRLVGLLACLRVGLMKASKEMNGKSRSSDSSSTENKIPDATVGKVSQNPTASDKSGLSFF